MLNRGCARSLHLWVEERGDWLNNRDLLIVSLNLVNSAVLVGDNSNKLKLQVLWLHIKREVVWHALLRTNADGNWLCLVVGDVDNGLVLLAVDQLDAEDLSLWEGGYDLDIEVWSDDLLLCDLVGGLYTCQLWCSLL